MSCLMGGGWMIFGMFFSSLLFIGFIVTVVLGIIWLARQSGQSRPSTPATESPEEILKRRYAQGEITAEQFEAMKRQLNL